MRAHVPVPVPERITSRRINSRALCSMYSMLIFGIGILIRVRPVESKRKETFYYCDNACVMKRILDYLHDNSYLGTYLRTSEYEYLSSKDIYRSTRQVNVPCNKRNFRYSCVVVAMLWFQEKGIERDGNIKRTGLLLYYDGWTLV